VAQRFKTPITVEDATSAASQAISVDVNGDTQKRLTIDAGGKVSWGDGTNAPDTTLYRSAANTLKTDDALEAASLGVSGEFTLPTADGTTGQVLQTNGSGTVTWATASGGGVTDHGALTGLGDDDHTQYLLADGTRSATSLDVTGNATVGDIVVDNGANITGHYTGWVKLGASNTISLGIDRNSIQSFGSSSGTYNSLDINTFGGNILLNGTAGNTGIGTASPSEKLDVVGNAEINGNIIVTGTVDGRDVAADGTKLDGIASGAVADHGALTGLGDDDHTQYLLADGTRTASALTVTGDIAVGGDITTSSSVQVIEQTGGAYGSTRLKVNGAFPIAGAIFEVDSLNLVDLCFTPSTTNYATFRFEGRSAYQKGAGNSTYGEFQLYLNPAGFPTTDVWGIYSGASTSGVATGDFSIDSGDLTVTGNITVTGTVDGRDVAADGTKLDGIEAGATNPGTDINTTVTTTTDTLAAGDVWKLTQYSNASLVTVTVPTGTFSAGDWFLLQSTGAGGLTLSTTGLTVTGSSTSVSEGEVIMVVFTASNTISVISGADDPKYATTNTPVTTTTHTLASGDLFELTQFSNASQVTVTVPTGTFVTGDWFMLQSTGAGGLTLSTTGITVNGAKTTIAESEGMMVVFTGSNTISVFGGTS